MGHGQTPNTSSTLGEKKSGKPAAQPKNDSDDNFLADTMSTLNYAWNVRGTFNGDFIGASGTTASIDGVADVNGTAGEGAPFNHSSWIWGGMGHYGLGFMKGGHKVNPCEKYPYHMTRHWYGEDGAHIWSSHNISGAEGAWAGDIACVGENFQPKGPILQGKVIGQYPSKGDSHIWYRAAFQLELNNGSYYSGYWEMDIHFRK